MGCSIFNFFSLNAFELYVPGVKSLVSKAVSEPGAVRRYHKIKPNYRIPSL